MERVKYEGKNGGIDDWHMAEGNEKHHGHQVLKRDPVSIPTKADPPDLGKTFVGTTVQGREAQRRRGYTLHTV
jgi:hypothetical protein